LGDQRAYARAVLSCVGMADFDAQYSILYNTFQSNYQASSRGCCVLRLRPPPRSLSLCWEVVCPVVCDLSVGAGMYRTRGMHTYWLHGAIGCVFTLVHPLTPHPDRECRR
jgi:hypothetical protein